MIDERVQQIKDPQALELLDLFRQAIVVLNKDRFMPGSLLANIAT
jgi:hypothetical protein